MRQAIATGEAALCASRETSGGSGLPAIILSAAMHGIAAALFFMAPPLAPPPGQEESVPVEIWTSDEVAAVAPLPPVAAVPALPAPPAVNPPSAAIPNSPQPAPAAPPAPRPRETIRAATMFSAGVINDPRSRGTAAFLRSLDADGRFEQLCNIEAMAQIGRAFPALRADRVIAYASADPDIRRDTLIARGAAFHSGRDWIDLSFTCRSSPDRRAIVAFEFSIGEAIPRRDWAAKRLPAER